MVYISFKVKFEKELTLCILVVFLHDEEILTHKRRSYKSHWVSIGNVNSVKRIKHGVHIHTNNGSIQITVCAPDVIRIRVRKADQIKPDHSWAVIQQKLGSQRFDLVNRKSLKIKTSKLILVIKKQPCRLAFYSIDGNLINQDAPSRGVEWSNNKVCIWKTMPKDEYYFGFGEKAGPLLRKGKAMSMWNSDRRAYKENTDPLYQSIPFFYGMQEGRAYGIFFDNTYCSFFDIGKEHKGMYSFGADDGELNYYFIFGPTPKEVLEKFSQLIGRMPLPPRWSLGYQQSRYSYYPESRVRRLASTFRKKKIPCDVIHLDIHYMDGYRCFTWDRKRFPNPKKMIADLERDGFKTVVILDPGIKREPGNWVYDEGLKGNHFVKYPDGKLFVGKVWPGKCVFPDFTRKVTREWWGSLHHNLIELGIKGFWNDMNEPTVFKKRTKTFDVDVIHDDNGLKTDHRKNHNIYGMQMARATYEGVVKLRPNERPFVLSRANFAGGHRYAAAWTGDNVSSWKYLKMAISMCLNFSISGQPFVGADIGGFIGNPSGELYTRWLQLGIFMPLMRTHTEIGTRNQEPWSYGKNFEAINRKSVELRYQLLPYIYTQFYLASVTGVPLMRPLFFDYPKEEPTYSIDHEFLFGDAFLVAPITEPRATKRSIYLPRGKWFDYWTGKKYLGPSTILVDAPINKIPLFVKAGSIIPTQQVLQYSEEEPINSLILEIYPSGRSAAILYEDDGHTFNYQNDKHSLRVINVNANRETSQVVLSQTKGNYKPPNRLVIVKLNDIQKRPSTVNSADRKLQQNLSRNQEGWKYDIKKKILWVKMWDRFRKQQVVIEF